MTQQQPAQNQTHDENLFSRVHDLVSAALEREISAAEAAELQRLVVENPATRRMVALYIQDSSALGAWAEAMPATSPEPVDEAAGWRLKAGGQEVPATLARSASEGVSPGALIHIPHSAFRISAIAAVVAFVAIGILAYRFWSGPAALPVVKQIPAAKIANLTDAKWEAAFSPAGNHVLTTGQRLILQSGSAEITFNSQAKIIVDGPAEFTIMDAGACRLADGKLTAHVPEPAKGFKVHTPDGTVTDLGTEFGVYVTARTDQQASREEEQQPGGGPQQDGTQPPVTEVHVFKGKVDVAPGDQLAQAPTSSIPHPPSTILQAGQAASVSDNKVQPLPAADPFKFALDKLQGKPRTVLLSEDFESYDVGVKENAIGP
ncbi:MAG: FecR family protein, partial [Planctomycetes bacterium]|nr:FecR family protein [Planctomycetota bacterium]